MEINLEVFSNLTEMDEFLNITLLDISANEFDNKTFNYNNNNISRIYSNENFLDKLSVQIFLIIAYTFVFCCCFIGKYYKYLSNNIL